MNGVTYIARFLIGILLFVPLAWSINAQDAIPGETVLIAPGLVQTQTFDSANSLVDLVFGLTYVDYTDRLYLNFSTLQQTQVVELEPSRYYPMIAALMDYRVGAENARDHAALESVRVAWRVGNGSAAAITDVAVRFSRSPRGAVLVLQFESAAVPFRAVLLDADQRLLAR